MSEGRAARSASVITHGRPAQSADALQALLRVAAETGTELRFDDQEVEKHELTSGPGVVAGGGYRPDSDLCVVLGGDGSILKGLRRQIWTGVPIFAVNLGEIGFLATIDPAEQLDGLRRAFAGDFEVLGLPALEATLPDGTSYSAINDISVNRRSGDRVAELQYGIDGEDVGQVRCDGLVVSTPAGSTGYNLANGGPILAWGVEGYAVSFIAPHTLSARALVVSPDGELTLHNGSSSPVELGVDGRPRGLIGAGEVLRIHFRREAAVLAQTEGTSFYRRLREKFGRLAG
ncbi:NAD(+)/NADH kinase [Patulibacter sp.]|uniref:NAD(+)/NADH kinase n=1 Tax=Patulibacter sp. TaxID=1912859 RepID=UPI0027178731|nr:NAD(+)/NADH kinase [Patulibacter sp.]MDO9407683.1 NAD(+)/NADH kinase [Patulibacter sp.]